MSTTLKKNVFFAIIFKIFGTNLYYENLCILCKEDYKKTKHYPSHDPSQDHTLTVIQLFHLVEDKETASKLTA